MAPDLPDPQQSPEDEPGPSTLVPYAADFTPTMLGKLLQPDGVLPWLLEKASKNPEFNVFQQEVETKCFHEVPSLKDKGDMSRRVLNSMKAYKLIELSGTRVKLTAVGEQLLATSSEGLDRAFARHILTSCNGQRLLDLLREHELRGEQPTLEDLARKLDRTPTSKNISSMRAWLARAGIFDPLRHSYIVNRDALEDVLGPGIDRVYRLSKEKTEFLLSARHEVLRKGSDVLEGPSVAELAENRVPGLMIPRKALGRFVQDLAERRLVELLEKKAGKGGSRVAFRLTEPAIELTDQQLRDFIDQSMTGFPLDKLLPLETLLSRLGQGSKHELGHEGEMLAVHLCLWLGLRVTAWRSRAAGGEIDLVAERTAALSYQRWHVQVKNVEHQVDGDRILREIGAASGLGVTHLLFVVPRAKLNAAAERERLLRSTLSSLHIYVLSANDLAKATAEAIIGRLRLQEALLSEAKRREAERRERTFR